MAATRNATKKPSAPKAPEAEAVETAQAPEADQATETKTVAVVVKAKFIDKLTREIRSVGDVIEVSPERLEEIRAAGEFVEELEADPAE